MHARWRLFLCDCFLLHIYACVGLSQAVLRGVLKKGYKVPTPIQRKVLVHVLVLSSVVDLPLRWGEGQLHLTDSGVLMLTNACT